MAKNKALPELARTSTRSRGCAEVISTMTAGSDPPDHLLINLDGYCIRKARNMVGQAAYRLGIKIVSRASADGKQLVVLLKEDADRLGI